MSSLRRSLDALLARKPGVMILWFDAQRGDVPGYPLMRSNGPWVCVDFEDGEKFAIWKNTGNVYRVGDGPLGGAVEDDPIIAFDGQGTVA
jgi:hypothetical protein